MNASELADELRRIANLNITNTNAPSEWSVVMSNAATAIDALTAERDEWKRKAEAAIESLAHMQWCRECGESSWEGCEGKRKQD